MLCTRACACTPVCVLFFSLGMLEKQAEIDAEERRIKEEKKEKKRAAKKEFWKSKANQHHACTCPTGSWACRSCVASTLAFQTLLCCRTPVNLPLFSAAI